VALCRGYVQLGPATATAAAEVGAHLTKLAAFLELEPVTRNRRGAAFCALLPWEEQEMSRRKEIALAMPVPCLGLHVSRLLSKPQKTSKPAKKVTISCSARSGTRLYKGKPLSCATIKTNTEV